ncbi:helix-turn-helix transcriptional regulator [Anaerocolumna sp.]|uniref:helix-turn-helix transcriptional regulator n=1 Tax=Anaerocolumna sp. TaxID=2041569 RepID=UPI0028A809ED|nr:AraC family transcriptional regulator [Anaerocolumna sp.]
MEIELNRLIAHYASLFFKVQGVYRYTIVPGTSGKGRTSPYPGIIFPMNGQAQYHFNGVSYYAKPSNVILGGANMALDTRVVGNTKWEYILVLYQVFYPEEGDVCLSKLHTELTVGHSTRLTELLYRLWNISDLPGGLPAFQKEMLFRCILDEVFVCARNHSEKGDGMLFEKVSSYIQEHYMESLSIHDLALQNGINDNQLYYIFLKNAGMGAGQYLATYRLNRAREMLITGNSSVKEIAINVGYPDPLYFSRSFRKRFGCSPSDFRKNQE